MDDHEDEATGFRCHEEEAFHIDHVADDQDNDTKEDKCGLTKHAPYKNLGLISIAFLLLFAGVNSLQNLQSSINVGEGLGPVGLTVIYVSVLISGVFLPPLLFSKFGTKWSMVASMFGFLAYTAAAFHATWATIIPSSVLLGVGMSVLWTGKLSYISELAHGENGIEKQ